MVKKGPNWQYFPQKGTLFQPRLSEFKAKNSFKIIKVREAKTVRNEWNPKEI